MRATSCRCSHEHGPRQSPPDLRPPTVLAPDITAAKLYEDVEIPTFDRESMPNPLVGTYPTKDGRFIIVLLLQADRFWPDLAEHLDRPDLIEDPRFKDGAARFEHREVVEANRRVSNRKARDELGFSPAYPSYVEGLEASL